jgi:hypothetical protein
LRYLEGGVLFGEPFGDEAGGQGVPEGPVPGPACDVPESLPELPGVGEEFGFDEPVLDEPGFDPEFGFEALGVPLGPGSGPQGDPFGVVPGLFGLFGVTVEGCEPGTVPGVVFLGVVPLVEPDPGEFGLC